MAAFQIQNAQQDNCFLSKGQTQKMHLEYLIISIAAVGEKEKKSTMNANTTVFDRGAESLFKTACSW